MAIERSKRRGWCGRIGWERYSDFTTAAHGAAAVEFALVVPVLLVLLLAGAEVVNAIENYRKVVQLSRTLADLTSQGDTLNPISTSLISDLLATAKPILSPYASNTTTIQISAVGVYQKNSQFGATICSTWPVTGTRALGAAPSIVVPQNYRRTGARYVLAEVSMPYKAILGSVVPRLVKGFNASLTWSEAVSWPVRGGTSINGDAEVIMPSGKACP